MAGPGPVYRRPLCGEQPESGLYRETAGAEPSYPGQRLQDTGASALPCQGWMGMHPRRSQADRVREILKRGKGSDYLFQPLRFYRSPERRISAGLGEGKTCGNGGAGDGGNPVRWHDFAINQTGGNNHGNETIRKRAEEKSPG